MQEPTEVLTLKHLGCIVPIAGIVLFIAGNVNLSDLGLNTDLGVSPNVIADTLTSSTDAIGVKVVSRDMRLETNSMNRASSSLQIFDQVEQGIRLLLAPVLGIEHTVVIDVQFGLRVRSMGPLERFADEIWDFGKHMVIPKSSVLI